MEGQGTFGVTGYTDKGHCVRAAFVDANVDMPILSVAEISSHGSRFAFDEDGGEIVSMKGIRSRFVRRRGVNFIKLRVDRPTVQPQDETEDIDFVWPVAPSCRYARLP